LASIVIESAQGIILRTRPLTETSLIVHWLTPSFGRIATVAKGARRPQSPFLGKLDLFYELDFSFSRSRCTDLHTLREAKLLETRSEIRGDLLRLTRAAYGCAFIEQATEVETPLPAVFNLLREFLKALCGQKPSAQLVLAFELKLLEELGLQPDVEGANLSAGTKKTAALLGRADFRAGGNVKATPAQLDEMRQFLHGFLVFHLGKLPRGRTRALAEQI
jgi:DNA repair protein RecO (recombination protein O)